MSFASWKDTIEEGDTVIIFISISQMHAIEIKPTLENKHGQNVDNIFQTAYGALRVMDLVGKRFGSRIYLKKGYVHVLYPTPELWTHTLPHRTQILYATDISMVIMQLEIHPGSVVCEAGTGSGSLSHSLLRAVGSTGHVYSCDFHEQRVQVAQEEFARHGFSDRVTLKHRDICTDGFGIEEKADAIFLDLPKPWEALPHAVKAMKKLGGRLCSFSPCMEQVSRTCEVLRTLGLREIRTMECLLREFQIRSINLTVLPIGGKADGNEVVLEEKEIENPKRVKLDPSSETEESKPERTVEEIEPKDVRFITGVPKLKMPGHTGFLTFATVPPNLIRC